MAIAEASGHPPVNASISLPAVRNGGTLVANLTWETDYTAALALAREQQKFVFLDVFNPG